MKEPSIFFEVFKNPSIFEFRGINTSKLFYDLTIAADEITDISPTSMRKLNEHNFLKKPLVSILVTFKCFLILTLSRGKIIFFGNENRLVKDKVRNYDVYNYKIIKELGGKKVLVIQERHDSIASKLYSPELVMDDLAPYFYLVERLIGIIYRRSIKTFIKQLGAKQKRIGFTEKTSETRLLKFYVRYLFYKFFLRVIQPKAALIVCHYSKHAFIAACKTNGIKTIELQHGQILPSHRYYNIPNVKMDYLEKFKQTFLPDYMAVYGDHWKKVLSEGALFNPENITNIGYFLKTPVSKLLKKNHHRVTIVITSSPQVQKDIIEYIRSIKSRLEIEGVEIVIKPHPSDNDSLYNDVVDNNFVRIDHTSLYSLLSQAQIHISVASSCLFDALLFEVDNYVLFVDRYQVVCNEILDTGIAKRLDNGKMPHIKDGNKKNHIDRRKYVDTFNKAILQKLIFESKEKNH